MVAKRPIPHTDTIARYVPKGRQKRHPETDEFEGVTPLAYRLRPDDEGGLSVAWIDYWGSGTKTDLVNAACAYRNALREKKLGPTALFALGNVGKALAAGVRFKKALRVVHAPVKGNDSHAEVRQFTDDDLSLLDVLNAEVFVDWHFVGDLDLPKDWPAS